MTNTKFPNSILLQRIEAFYDHCASKFYDAKKSESNMYKYADVARKKFVDIVDTDKEGLNEKEKTALNLCESIYQHIATAPNHMFRKDVKDLEDMFLADLKSLSKLLEK